MMHVKPPLILHFLISQRTKKMGWWKSCCFGGWLFCCFFWPSLAWDQQYFTYWRLVGALNCLLHTIWHRKAACQTLSYAVFQWNETQLTYSCSGFGPFLCLCKITRRLPSLMQKSTALSLGVRAPSRYSQGVPAPFRTGWGNRWCQFQINKVTR